jgi:pyruvate/2-oxoglutarate dehydrogenase complex dihydrolipoamide dehydrogenase (E3) component
VTVGEKSYSSKKIVIAAGSRAAVPPIPGLDTVDFLTNETIFDLDTTPRHLVVLGAGPIGLELGQGFRHLGAEVTIIDRGERLFSKDEPEASPLMEKVFLDDGITLKLRAQIKSVRQSGGKIAVVIEKDGVEEIVEGDRLLVSLGRVPNTRDLGLETAGVQLNARGSIITNAKLQTNVKSIYACGDVCGPYQFTHTAGYQAAIVIRNVLFGLNAKQNYDGIAWTTYTKPEVAHVGLLEKDAKTKGVLKKTVFVPLAENDRAKAEDDRDGFLKLIVSKAGRLIGATLIGEKAGEMIPAATLAIKRRLRVSVFLGLILSYPTEAEIFKAAALSDLKDSVAPWQTKLLRFFFRS